MDFSDLSGSISLPNIEEGIPDKVTTEQLRMALEAYARADKEWKDYNKMKYLSAKEDAGDHLYRLAKAILIYNGFYTHRPSTDGDILLSNPPESEPAG